MRKSTSESPPSYPDKPEISYPCTWVYKVIGEDIEIMRQVIITACAPAEVDISHSNSSSGGRYHSLNAALEVENEEVRLQIYALLKNHPTVKFVL